MQTLVENGSVSGYFRKNQISCMTAPDAATVALRGVRETGTPRAPTDTTAAAVAAAADDVGCPDVGDGVHPPKPAKLGAGSNGVEE
jgi:hypothetical protein